VTGPILQGTDRNFYGTTPANVNDLGTVFRIAPTGKLVTLHTFAGKDGNNPVANLIQSTEGSFLGTTEWGGSHDDGTVFKITRKGQVTVLHSFEGFRRY
jgi:uncharacterized repeat protein (TIGR03803 family)